MDLKVSKILEGLLVGAPCGTAVVGVGNLLTTLKRYPEAITSAYRALWRWNQIGPVTKTTITVASPLVLVAVPCAVTLGSAVFGLGYGFYRCAGLSDKDEGGIVIAFDAFVDILKKFDEDFLVNALVALDKYAPSPLPEGEEPFDISYMRGLRALGSMIVLGPVEGMGLTLATWRRVPRAVYEAYRAIWRVKVRGAAPRVLKLAVGILIVPTTSLAVLATRGWRIFCILMHTPYSVTLACMKVESTLKPV